MNTRFIPSLKRIAVASLLFRLSTAAAFAQETTSPPSNTPDGPTQISSSVCRQGDGAKPAEPEPSEPSVPAPGTFTFSGLVDFYYGINFRKPGGTAAPFAPAFTGAVESNGNVIRIDNAARFNDINDRELSFSLGELDITRTQGKGLPFGFRATLTVGEAPRFFHATEPGGPEAWQTFHNLYLTRSFRAADRDMSVDAGIFSSPFGVEVLESTANDNYSRSMLYIFSPFYHMGARLNTPITNNLSLQAGVVNGWNNIADDNDDKSGYLQFTYKPNSRLTTILSWIGGEESTGLFGPLVAPKGNGSLFTSHFDLNAVWQVTDRTKLTAWFLYGNGAGSINGAQRSGNWIGYALYAKHQITPQWSIAGRVDQVEDIPGANNFGVRFGATGYTKLQSGTVTLEYAPVSRVVTRLEYRHDSSNVMLFGSGNTGTIKDQDTLTMSAAYKF